MRRLNTKQKYRAFLKSAFWLDLSARKRALNPVCERCGDAERLQVHHKIYRKDWEATEIGDLETLCRLCHQKEHGIVRRRFMLYRDDERFSAFIHWCHYLRQRLICKAIPLKRREIGYLKAAVRCYPPKPKDTAMRFQVTETLKTNKLVHTFK